MEHVQSIPGASQFALIDPKDLSMKPVIVTPGTDALAANLSQKRKTKSVYAMDKRKHQYYEAVSMIAFEGSTLTLMGLVKYDTEAKAFKMTEVSGIVAGGLKECKKIMEHKIQN